jgi:hypothetical protein
VSAPRLVSIADVIRACRTLELPLERWPEVARILGMEILPPATREPVVPPPPPEPPPRPPRDESDGDAFGAPAAPRPDARRRRGAGPPVPASLHALEGDPAQPPAWVLGANGLDEPAEDVPQAQPAPLIAPQWSRGVLEALVATAAHDGPIDVVRTVALLARQEPFAELPRRSRPTLSRGAQVLVDTGPGLVPFASDQAALVRDLARIVAGAELELLRFAGTPLSGAGPGRRRTWTAWRPPTRPRPVLLVTDLGAGPSGAPVSEWLRVAAILRRAGCPAVALVPYPPTRYPLRLRRAFALVLWDRPTSVRAARRATGGVLEVAS